MSVGTGISAHGALLDTVFAQDPTWLLHARREGLEAFAGQPDARYERSDMAHRDVHAFAVAPSSAEVEWQTIAAPYLADGAAGPVIVVAGGRIVAASGCEELAQQGVLFCGLRTAAREHEAVVRAHLHTVVAPAEHPHLGLGAALWREGAFVHVNAGVRCTQALTLVVVAGDGGQGEFVHNLVIAQEGAEVTVVEVIAGAATDVPSMNVFVTEVVAAQGANVKLGAVQDLPAKATSVIMRRAKVDRDASVDWVMGETGDGYNVIEFGSRLVGTGGRSTSHAVVLGSGRAHMDITAKMVHIGSFSDSDTSARGVMQGRARAIYRGFTQIDKGAHGANGQQAERLLMLSKDSRADAIPMLLIDENDVKCGHAASVGQIDEEQLFYLMSRGISEMEAKRLVIWGFVDPVLVRMPIDAARIAVEAALERKLR
jgi:Fe-S cluster assembly protein SufD